MVRVTTTTMMIMMMMRKTVLLACRLVSMVVLLTTNITCHSTLSTTWRMSVLASAVSEYVHHVSKNCAKLFFSELRQISTNFDNFWPKHGIKAKIMHGALFSTSPNLRHHTAVLNANV